MIFPFLSNVATATLQRCLRLASRQRSESLEHIVTGKRILKPSDDPVGYAIASRLDGELSGLQEAQREAMRALSVIQTAEGGVNEINNLLLRLREIALQSENENLTDKERDQLKTEMQELREEVRQLSAMTKHEGAPLLSGDSRTFSFRVGTGHSSDDHFSIDLAPFDSRPETLGLEEMSVGDSDDANDSVLVLDEALARVELQRAKLGALQSRLHPVIATLSSEEGILSDARSRIVDADLAKEITESVHADIRGRAATAILAQANVSQRAALRILGESSPF